MKQCYPLAFLVLLFGCDKRYTYTQYGRAFDGKTFEGKVIPYGQEIITARSDADAYKKALLKFGSRIVLSKEMLARMTDSSELSSYSPYPYCYVLLAADGKRVSSTVRKDDRFKAQQEAFKLLEDRVKMSGRHITLSRQEVLARDLIK
jgi:hypothetical protein